MGDFRITLVTGRPRVLDLGRLLLGLAVVTIGVLFLLDAAGVLNADRAIGHWWPILIVAAGVLTLAERPPAVVRGTILTGIGVVLLLFTTHLLHKTAWNYVWPALVVIAGLVIVLRWRGRAVISGAQRGGRRALDRRVRRPEPGLYLAAVRGRVADGGVRRDHARSARRAARCRRSVGQRDGGVRRDRHPGAQGMADQRAQHADLRRPGRQDRPLASPRPRTLPRSTSTH